MAGNPPCSDPIPNGIAGNVLEQLEAQPLGVTITAQKTCQIRAKRMTHMAFLVMRSAVVGPNIRELRCQPSR